ncbi:MAG: methionine biosynthesis protein MetW [Armatimonadetes bacterium]|nr:methionine biosynthesis protein MetW [Armatimonadota bacterium]
MGSHPQVAEAIAYLASLDAGFPGGAEDAHRERWDHELIVSLIPKGAGVLDLGCGSGSLLERLTRDKGCHGQGVERDQAKVLRAVKRAVPVIQHDFDTGLGDFPDASYDYVVLETTLQTVSRPETVLQEMLRVGRVGIVSFPNYGHWWVRTQLLIQGRMPVTPRFPHTWFGSPDIHVFTIRDFEDWCAANGVVVRQRFAYAEGAYHEMLPADNVLAEEALFVIGRDDQNPLLAKEGAGGGPVGPSG